MGQLLHVILLSHETNMLLFYSLLHLILPYVLCEPCLRDWTFIPRLHTCYLTPHHPLTWQAAEHHCQDEGGHLVSVESIQESQFIRALADQHNPQFFTWIGLKRNANALDDIWTWSSGAPVNYTDFQHGQPSEWGDCVALSSSLENPGWVTVDCEYSQFFLCQMPADGNTSTILKAEAGEFYSPGFPGDYPQETFAYYFIELPFEKKIAVTVEYIDTEEMHDILQLFDGPSETSRTLARLSGKHYNRSFLSTTNSLMAEFSSDSGGSGRGFKVRYTSWSVPPIERLSRKGGKIYSRNFPEYAPPFTFQHFLIQCFDEEHIHLNVTDLELSLGDVLVFHEGSISAHGLLKRVTSTDQHLPILLRSKGNTVYIMFEAKDSYALSRWRFGYDCVRKDGVGEEVVIE